MYRNTLAYRIVPWLVVAMLNCGWLSTVAAQEDKVASEDQSVSPKRGAKAETPAAKSKLNVTETPILATYRLKHADLEIAEKVIGTVAGVVQIIDDPRTHSLMVVALPDSQRKVAELLEKIDNLPVPEELIKVFSLVNANPASAAKAISTIVPKVRVSIDERSRQIIAAGSMDTLNVVKALITKLDEPQKTGVTRYDVRVIWLASGLSGEGRGESPTDDLKDVVAELSRLGIKDTRQVGQMVVQTTSGGSYQGRFDVKSSPHFGDQMADFNASGLLSERPDGPGLVMQIRLRTRKEPSPPEQNLNEINTQIVLPQKQYVVLATAPTGNLTSIFVVQVTEVTNGPEKKGNR
jgi:hypothetical protein